MALSGACPPERRITMLYTPLTKKALKLCYEAHRDQTDQSGLPYVFHPFHLAEQMEDENTVVTALLHDTVEDTWVTPDYLKQEGYPEEVLEAVALLTRPQGLSYMDYVRRLSVNPIARKVKLADLRHNSDLTRLDRVDDYALKRAAKYKKAMKILEEAGGDL